MIVFFAYIGRFFDGSVHSVKKSVKIIFNFFIESYECSLFFKLRGDDKWADRVGIALLVYCWIGTFFS